MALCGFSFATIASFTESQICSKDISLTQGINAKSEVDKKLTKFISPEEIKKLKKSVASIKSCQDGYSFRVGACPREAKGF